MALSDPIADMLTRVRNAALKQAKRVDCRNSKICAGIAQVLKDEGYVQDFSVVDDGRQGILRIDLRYGPQGEQLIHTLKRESKPGCLSTHGPTSSRVPWAGLASPSSAPPAA